MVYLVSMLEGLSSFISPCILPMLPMYLSYFSGTSNPEERSVRRTLLNVISFILGFSLVLFSLGAFSGLVGKAVISQLKNSTIINIVAGGIVLLLGLSYVGLFRIPFFDRLSGPQMDPQKLQRLNVVTSFLFGIIFSIAWSPCTGAFLGAGLSLSASSGTILQGGLIMLFYSIGLGIPFFLTALLMDQLTSVFDFIKKHYGIITKISGGFLILTGIAMMTGLFQKLLLYLTF